jgi:hypothetical protein
MMSSLVSTMEILKDNIEELLFYLNLIYYFYTFDDVEFVSLSKFVQELKLVQILSFGSALKLHFTRKINK